MEFQGVKPLTEAKEIVTIETSMQIQDCEEKDVPNLKDLREEAGLTAFSLAAQSGVSLSTINRLEGGGEGVTRRKANQVLNFLSQKLGRKVTIEDMGLKIKD